MSPVAALQPPDADREAFDVLRSRQRVTPGTFRLTDIASDWVREVVNTIRSTWPLARSTLPIDEELARTLELQMKRVPVLQGIE
jgi:hypothetical protein